MTNELDGRVANTKDDSEKSSQEKSLCKTLFDEAKDGLVSLFGDKKDARQAANESQVSKTFGNLMLTDSSSNPEETVARRANAKFDPSKFESVKEAQAAIVNPQSSQEQKLAAANLMAKEGQTTFNGPDGRRYDISLTDAESRTLVSIHTSDKSGNSHPVLRGYIESDGSLHKQTDGAGKDVPYEGTWASRNLKDSPLIGSPEKAPSTTASPENNHLLQTMKDAGITPGHQNETDKIQLAKQHDQLVDDLENKKDHVKALRARADQLNAPLDAEATRLSKTVDKTFDQISDIRNDVIKRDEKLASELKDKGIGSGSRINVDDAAAMTKVRSDIDSSSIDPVTKRQLKSELDSLDKRNKDLQHLEALNDKTIARIDALNDKMSENLKTVAPAQKEVHEAFKKVRENENAIAESKFTDDLKTIDKLPPQQRAAVYASFEKIAKDAGAEPNHLTAGEKKELVTNLAHQIAYPESIKQGNKGTCGLASTELELAKGHPDKYAQIVADLATKGVANTADGRQMKIQSDLINVKDKDGNLVPHDDSNHERSMVSKIFQSSAANRVLEDRAQNGDTLTYDTQRPGSKYPIEIGEINLAGKGDVHSADDTGERIVHKDGTVEMWNGVDASEIAKLTSDITGGQYEAVPIVKGRDLSKAEQEKAAEADFIAAAEKNGLPMKVSVTMTKGDFTGMNAEGGHELVVTRIEKGSPNMVYFDNTAGGTDHSYPTGRPVPLKDFLNAMQKTKMSDGNEHDEGYVIVRKAA